MIRRRTLVDRVADDSDLHTVSISSRKTENSARLGIGLERGGRERGKKE
jgi:hypothetical protein